MAEELEAACPGLFLMSDAIRGRDEDTVRDRVRALNRPPRVDLCFAEAVLLSGMPADRRRIEEDVGTEEARDSRGLRVPLIPADEHSNVSVARLPDTEAAGTLRFAVIIVSHVARREVV